MAEQLPIAQRRLVDDLGAAAHGNQRARHLVIEAARVGSDIDHRTAICSQAVQVRALMFVVLAGNQRSRLVRRNLGRPSTGVVKALQVEYGQVLALQKADQVGGREEIGLVAKLHRRSAPEAAGAGAGGLRTVEQGSQR